MAMHMSRDKYLEIQKMQAVAIAGDMIHGRLNLFEGVFQMALPLRELRCDNDPDWISLKVIADEVAHLRIGKKVKSEEMQKLEGLHRDKILKACQHIVERLSGRPGDNASPLPLYVGH